MRLFQQRRDWGLELTGFGRPFGIGADSQGRLLVTDMDCHVVIRFDAGLDSYQYHDGSSNWTPPIAVAEGVGSTLPGLPRPGGWNGPHSVESTMDGRLLVCCYYRPMIVALLPDGRCEQLIGAQFLSGPATLRADKNGRMFIAEYAKNLVLVFDQGGGYVRSLGHTAATDPLDYNHHYSAVPASSVSGGFDRLHMAMPLADGYLLVADTWNNRLQRVSPNGEAMVWPVPDTTISCPVAVDEDANGRILVTAWGSSRLLLFGRDGHRLELGEIPDLNKPYDARFYRDGCVVADSHNGRVLVFDKLMVDDPELTTF